MTAPPVLLVTFADPAGSGGVPRTLRHLQTGLAERGHAVTLLSHPLMRGVRNTLVRRPGGQGRNRRQIDASSEEVHRIRKALRSLEAEVRAGPPDAVCMAFEAWTAAVCAQAARRTIYRVAGLGSITDEWIRNRFIDGSSRQVPWLRERERAGFASTDRLVVLSEAGRRAVSGLGAAPDRICVIPNGIDVGTAPERLRASGRPVTILSVANLRHVKGVDVLARAVAALDESTRGGVRLLHVGDGNEPGNPCFEAALDALDAAGVQHEFRGVVSADGVAAALAEADVFVLPSRVEMFPNALLEAMASGLPAIGTDVGAVPEILGQANAASGLLVPPDDAGALSHALAALLRSDALRRDRGAANRERIRESFSLTSTLDAYAALIRRVAAG